MSLLDIEGLGVAFEDEDGHPLPAVQNVSFSLEKGAVTCLVGESGCGKSLTARAILGILPRGATAAGSVRFEDRELIGLPEKTMSRLRGRSMAMIFQEPMTALNPVLTVGEQAAEPLRLHLGLSKAEARKRVIELFAEVGIPSPGERYTVYPHELSGGMRQRVMIAMALTCRPSLLLADEPTTALDATIQGQVLSILNEERVNRGMAVLLITHDLGVVAQIADSVGVMYAGRLVEYGSLEELFPNPLHPYTRGLMAAAPTRASFRHSRHGAAPGFSPSQLPIPSPLLTGSGHMPRISSPRDSQERPQGALLARGAAGSLSFSVRGS
mgnify:CR=1 FL=1